MAIGFLAILGLVLLALGLVIAGVVVLIITLNKKK